MSKSKKTLASIISVTIAVGVFYYFKQKELLSFRPGPGLRTTKLLSSTLFNNGAVPKGLPTLEEMEAKVAEQEAELQAKKDAYKDYFDEYGFPKKIDLKAFSYSTPELLFKEGDYTYSIYVRETEGNMPIVKESSTTKEYIGLTIGWQDIQSLDNHKFIYASGIEEKICMAQIEPKIVQCVSPVKSDETFIYRGGNYDESFVDGKWLDNDTFEYSVFKKDKKSTEAETNGDKTYYYSSGIGYMATTSQFLRKEIFILK